jgi:hypothetical protein
MRYGRSRTGGALRSVRLRASGDVRWKVCFLHGALCRRGVGGDRPETSWRPVIVVSFDERLRVGASWSVAGSWGCICALRCHIGRYTFTASNRARESRSNSARPSARSIVGTGTGTDTGTAPISSVTRKTVTRALRPVVLALCERGRCAVRGQMRGAGAEAAAGRHAQDRSSRWPPVAVLGGVGTGLLGGACEPARDHDDVAVLLATVTAQGGRAVDVACRGEQCPCGPHGRPQPVDVTRYDPNRPDCRAVEPGPLIRPKCWAHWIGDSQPGIATYWWLNTPPARPMSSTTSASAARRSPMLTFWTGVHESLSERPQPAVASAAPHRRNSSLMELRSTAQPDGVSDRCAELSHGWVPVVNGRCPVQPAE